MRKNGFKPRPLATTFTYQPVQTKSPSPALEKEKREKSFGRTFLFFTALWMFALGIIVGRVTTPPDFDLNAVEKELGRLRESEIQADQQAIRNGMETLNDTHLDFYDDLRKNSRSSRTVPPPAESGGSPEVKKALVKKKEFAEALQSSPENTSGEKPDRKADEKTGENAGEKTAESEKIPVLPPLIPLSGNVEMNIAIQLASFARLQDSDRVVSELSGKGYKGIYVSTEKVEGVGTRYRIRMGYFRNRSDARMVLEQLKNRENYKDAYIFQQK